MLPGFGLFVFVLFSLRAPNVVFGAFGARFGDEAGVFLALDVEDRVDLGVNHPLSPRIGDHP